MIAHGFLAQNDEKYSFARRLKEDEARNNVVEM